MSGWDLPTALLVSGEEREIRWDFRAILDIIAACNDPDLPDWAKLEAVIEILYVDEIPKEQIEEAYKQACWFIDCGETAEPDPVKKPKLMDWEQDASMIFPAINKVAGREVRDPGTKVHWWTFIGYFYEIDDGLFSKVLSIRQKKAKGKKLEKHELEYYRENRKIIDLRTPMTEQEAKEMQMEKAELERLFGGKR